MHEASYVLAGLLHHGSHLSTAEHYTGRDRSSVRALRHARFRFWSAASFCEANLDLALSIRGVPRGYGLKMGEVNCGRFEVRIRELMSTVARAR